MTLYEAVILIKKIGQCHGSCNGIGAGDCTGAANDEIQSAQRAFDVQDIGKSELEHTKTGKAALETQLAAKIDELAALNTTLGEKEDIITALEADIDDLEAAIDEKDAVITALNDTVASLEKTVADAEAEIAAKQAKIDELTALLETANAELNDIHSNCPYCGKVHQNVFDKFFCMIIRFFDFLVGVFEFTEVA